MCYHFWNMDKTRHCIQILTLREEGQKQIIKVAGFIYAEDKNQIIFNPSIKNSKKGHWTRHRDGKVHLKDENGTVIFSHNRIPLSEFKGQRQFLFSAYAKDSDINLDYKLCEDSAIF